VKYSTSRFRAIIFTAYVVVLLAVTMPLAWIVLLMLPRGRPSDVWVKRWARAVIAASGCPMRVIGREHLPRDRPAVLVSNHTSYLDSVVLMAAIPIAYRFVVAARYAAWPMIGTAIRKAAYVTVDRRSAATRAVSVDRIESVLRGGSSVLIYPEGHRVRGAELEPFRAGAFRAAVDTRSPIVPITVRGTRVVMAPGARLFRPGAIDVIIHSPIEPAGNDRKEIIRLRDAARSAIECGLSRA
jgi:1-acyl-sn-glycerol-3-phosphate acyltransferase